MKQNFTCESDSPLIEYDGAWAAQVGDVPGSLNASSAIRMVSQKNGDVALFNFTGTGVWVYPASNTPHGSYEVYLDGTPSRFNASIGPTDISAPLFQGSNLLSIPHVLSIHNTGTNGTNGSGTSYLDLAVITWEERDKYGNATDISIQGNEDDASSFSWHPFDMWTAETQTIAQDPSAGVGSPSISLTVHTANYSNAWMQYNFSANTISIYGNVGPTQGPYSVLLQYVLDDGTTTINDPSHRLPDERFFNGSFPFNRTKVLLFHATNINASRTTTLKLTNHPDKQGDSVSIDYSVLSRYVTDSNSGGSRSSFPVPAMVGSIIGALLMLGIVLVAMYFLRRRRQGQLIRQQKTNIFRDLLAKRGVLASPEGNDLKKGTPDDSNHERDHDTTKQ